MIALIFLSSHSLRSVVLVQASSSSKNVEKINKFLSKHKDMVTSARKQQVMTADTLTALTTTLSRCYILVIVSLRQVLYLLRNITYFVTLSYLSSPQSRFIRHGSSLAPFLDNILKSSMFATNASLSYRRTSIVAQPISTVHSLTLHNAAQVLGLRTSPTTTALG
jgi:hypothetical protein